MNNILSNISGSKAALWFCAIIAVLGFAFPATTRAARAGGGTTMTHVEYCCPTRWVTRVDPPAGTGLKVIKFQLSVSYDSMQMHLLTSTQKFPFSFDMGFPMDNGMGVVRVAGTAPLDITLGFKDVDIFE